LAGCEPKNARAMQNLRNNCGKSEQAALRNPPAPKRLKSGELLEAAAKLDVQA
jgi:hypothetical protein